MGKFSEMGHALYEGRISIDFVGRRRLWYSISGLIVLAALGGLLFKGLNLGIEFRGGVEYAVSVKKADLNQNGVDEVRKAVTGAGIAAASSPTVNTSGNNIRVQTEAMSNDDTDKVITAIADKMGIDPQADISTQEVGASWGSQVRDPMITGLTVFLILVTLFIWAYFREWKMSVAAIVALVHDLIITIGVYALSGFEVTPATVTGVLTILGFSLYDTVVVFDKVRENTKNLRQSRQTYSELANLAINQTLVRSINTSLGALLPVGALLYVGVVSLGSGALKDLALALFVGMAAGAYSSVFIATPLVVQLKELEQGIKAGDARALRHRGRRAPVDPYASVPSFSEDLPLHEEPGVDSGDDDDREPVSAEGNGVPATTPSRPARFTAGDRPASRPVSPSASAKRAQPSRKPRSQRGKG